MYQGIEEKAREMAEKAKPGILKVDGKIYTFSFCQREGVYKIYEDGFFLMSYNCKSLNTAKNI